MSTMQHDVSETIVKVTDDFVVRRRAGERPSIEAYEHNYPEIAEQVRRYLPLIDIIEQAAAHVADNR